MIHFLLQCLVIVLTQQAIMSNKSEPCFGQNEAVLSMIKQHHISKSILAFILIFSHVTVLRCSKQAWCYEDKNITSVLFNTHISLSNKTQTGSTKTLNKFKTSNYFKALLLWPAILIISKSGIFIQRTPCEQLLNKVVGYIFV